MRTIWKFELKVGSNKVKMPEASEILSAGQQDGKVMLWAEVETKGGEVERPFLVVGTGEEISEDVVLDYTGTVKTLVDGKIYMLHVFEIL